MIGLVPGVGNLAAGGIIAKDLYDDKNLVKNQLLYFIANYLLPAF